MLTCYTFATENLPWIELALVGESGILNAVLQEMIRELARGGASALGFRGQESS